MPRRPNGHSSIFKGYDGRWHGWVTMNIGTPGPARDRRHVSGKTREIVLAKVAELERQRGERDAPPSPGEAIDTVRDWIGYWLVHIAGQRTKEVTCRRYRLIMERNVLPRLGSVQLRKLHEHHLDDLYGRMLGEGATPTTLKEVRRVLSTALNEAVSRELVPRNVARRSAIPKAVSPEIEPLTVEEAQRVFATAAELPNGAAWLVAIALGLRRSEVLALHWDDIDLDEGTVSVRRALERTPWSHGCDDPIACCFELHTTACTENCTGHARLCPQRRGGLSFTFPKSQSGNRTVVMPPTLHRVLQQHRRDQRPLPGRTRRHGGLVFRSTDGSPLDPNQVSQAWKALLRAAGVRQVRLHDARHSAATFLLMQGVDPRTTMAIMGWAHIEVAQRYQHAVTPLRRDAADRIEALLWPHVEPTSDKDPGGS